MFVVVLFVCRNYAAAYRRNEMMYAKPTSEFEFKEMLKNDRVGMYCECVQCKNEFSSENTHTELGWKETQISGMCEDCFDNLFIDEEQS